MMLQTEATIAEIQVLEGHKELASNGQFQWHFHRNFEGISYKLKPCFAIEEEPVQC
jgi:hypothetical protein